MPSCSVSLDMVRSPLSPYICFDSSCSFLFGIAIIHGCLSVATNARLGKRTADLAEGKQRSAKRQSETDLCLCLDSLRNLGSLARSHSSAPFGLTCFFAC